jgi:hypothetical protein
MLAMQIFVKSGLQLRAVCATVASAIQSGGTMNLLRSMSLAAALLGAVGGTSLLAEDWTTLDGVTYKDVKVIKVEDDAVTILYHDGGALIRMFRLPPALQARFHYDPEKAHAAAAARTQSDTDNRVALSQERVQAEQVRAAKDAKYEADQAAAHAALATNNAPWPDTLNVAQFSSLGPTPDANHHTMGETTQQMRLFPAPDPNHRTVSQAPSTNDPDMPVMPQ